MRKNKSNNCFLGSKNKLFNLFTMAVMILPLLVQLFIGSTSIKAEEPAANPPGYGSLIKDSSGTHPGFPLSLTPNFGNDVQNSRGGRANTDGSGLVMNQDSYPMDDDNSYLAYGPEGLNKNVLLRKIAKQTGTPGEFDVSLNVRGRQIVPNPLDIVFVVDRSDSMNWDSDTNGNRIPSARPQIIKDGLKKAIADITKNKLLKQTVKVGVVTFGGTGPKGQIGQFNRYSGSIDSNDEVTDTFPGPGLFYDGITKTSALKKFDDQNAVKQELDKFIDEIEFNQNRTFTQAGLIEANKMLDIDKNYPKKNKLVVLLTDGKPNMVFKPLQYVPGKASDPDFGNYDYINVGAMPTEMFDVNEAATYYDDNPWRDADGIGEPYYLAPNIVNGLNQKIDNYWVPTIGTAKYIQEHSQLFGFAIKIPNDTDKWKFRQIAGQGRTQYSSNSNELSEQLGNLIPKIKKSLKTVEKGTINDPIGDQFELVGNPTINYVEGRKAPVSNNESDSDGLPVVKATAGRSTISVSNLNLGSIREVTDIQNDQGIKDGEEVVINYKVRIKNTAPGFLDNTWYPINKKTTIKPAYDDDQTYEFAVPSARYSNSSLTVKKEWFAFDGTKLDGDSEKVPDTMQAKVYKTVNGTKSLFKTLQLSKENGWTETISTPKFEGSNHNITYTVEEDISNLENWTLFETEDSSDSNSQREGPENRIITLKNKSTLPVPSIEVNKVGPDGSSLTGADFSLTDISTNARIDNSSNEDTKFVYTDLAKDTNYNLSEEVAPEGYQKVNSPFKITFKKKGNRLVAQVYAPGYLKDTIKETRSLAKTDDDLYEVATDTNGRLKIHILNSMNLNLPLTGGTDYQREIVLFFVPIIMMIIGASFYQFYLKRQNEI